MLSDQGSPYVGRFARGWRRLPGMIPGQPQTRTRARSSIGRSPRAQERPGGGNEHDLRRAGLEQRLGARGSRRSRREHVVDEQHVRGHRNAIWNDERAPHGGSPLGSVALGLGAGRLHPPEKAPHRKAGLPANLDRQHLRLIEASLGLSAAGKRRPRHDVGAAGNAGAHGGAERPGDAAHAPILQVMHRLARGPLERERRPGARDRIGRALTTSGDGTGR